MSRVQSDPLPGFLGDLETATLTKKRAMSPGSATSHEEMAKRLRLSNDVYITIKRCLHCHSLDHSWSLCDQQCLHCSEPHPRKRCPRLALSFYLPARGFTESYEAHSTDTVSADAIAEHGVTEPSNAAFGQDVAMPHQHFEAYHHLPGLQPAIPMDSDTLLFPSFDPCMTVQSGLFSARPPQPSASSTSPISSTTPSGLDAATELPAQGLPALSRQGSRGSLSLNDNEPPQHKMDLSPTSHVPHLDALFASAPHADIIHPGRAAMIATVTKTPSPPTLPVINGPTTSGMNMLPLGRPSRLGGPGAAMAQGDNSIGNRISGSGASHIQSVEPSSSTANGTYVGDGPHSLSLRRPARLNDAGAVASLVDYPKYGGPGGPRLNYVHPIISSNHSTYNAVKTEGGPRIPSLGHPPRLGVPGTAAAPHDYSWSGPVDHGQPAFDRGESSRQSRRSTAAGPYQQTHIELPVIGMAGAHGLPLSQDVHYFMAWEALRDNIYASVRRASNPTKNCNNGSDEGQVRNRLQEASKIIRNLIVREDFIGRPQKKSKGRGGR